MRVIKSIRSLRNILSSFRKQGKTIGFVPTMGALHEGHLSLIRRSRRENDVTVLSIFVNPKQFGPKEDLGKYPRPEKKDEKLAKKEKVDIIFYPSEETMYPDGYQTYINVEGLSEVLCGAFRPGHFRGVATIVGKLLNLVMPDKMYLGQKDFQQAALLKKMVKDLNWNVTIRAGATIREKDGLAISSRNEYLTEKQRREAPVLGQALQKAKQKASQKYRTSKEITQLIRGHITQNSSARIEYISCVKQDTLQPVDTIKGNIVIALAAWFGQTRLIDNITLSVK